MLTSPWKVRTGLSLPFAGSIGKGRVAMISCIFSRRFVARAHLREREVSRSARGPRLPGGSAPWGLRKWSGQARWVPEPRNWPSGWIAFSRNNALAGPRGDLPGARPAVTVPGKRETRPDRAGQAPPGQRRRELDGAEANGPSGVQRSTEGGVGGKRKVSAFWSGFAFLSSLFLNGYL